MGSKRPVGIDAALLLQMCTLCYKESVWNTTHLLAYISKLSIIDSKIRSFINLIREFHSKFDNKFKSILFFDEIIKVDYLSLISNFDYLIKILYINIYTL